MLRIGVVEILTKRVSFLNDANIQLLKIKDSASNFVLSRAVSSESPNWRKSIYEISSKCLIKNSYVNVNE